MTIVKVRVGDSGNETEHAINLDAIAYVVRYLDRPDSLLIHFIGAKDHTLTLHDLKLGDIQRIIGR